MNKRVFTFIFLMSVIRTASAEVVDEETAYRIANSIIPVAHERANANARNAESVSASSAPAYYIYKGAEGKGFVVISGEDATRPILGYSTTSTIDEMPSSMQYWLEDIEMQISELRNSSQESSAEVQELWRSASLGSAVVQLTTAEWDQGAPFNYQCPVINGRYAYTGCVATAYAIIMKYYGYPNKGRGWTDSYYTSTENHFVERRNLGHSYDWNNMPLSYYNYNDQQANEVAQLMADIGSAIMIDYKESATAGYHFFPQMATYFDYDPGVFSWKSNYSSDEWDQKLRKELDEGRPIFYRGENSSSAHAFVLDGYTADGYYGVNWGWGGAYNGYFLLDVLSPYSGRSYSSRQGAVLGFMPLYSYQDAIGENTIQGHEYVDLGLPSGLLWATCNIGAERPEQNGEYYAWGETSAKSRYDWNTYQLGSQASNNSISAYGINDGRYTLTSTNDAAAKNWGSQWSIPSKMQFEELLSSCTWRQTTVNGVLCMEGKGPNGNKILFPYAGAMNITDCQHWGSYGTYWTNEVNAEQCYRGKVFFISKLYPKPEMWDNSGLRYIGNSIRAVSKADDGMLEGGFCGYGNDLRYAIYDDLSMQVVGSGYCFNSYSDAWQKSQYKKLVKTVSLPEGLSQIGYESFRGNSGLTTITIPESVTSIGSYAFADCSKLTSMYVGKVPPSCYQSTFSGIQSTCTLYVPTGCKSRYQQYTGWNGFTNIVEYATSNVLAFATNVLYIDNIEVLTGETCTLAIKMKNGNDPITNLEFVLQLPENVTITNVNLNDERITDHQVSYNVLSAGKLKVMVTSFNRETIWDNDGDLVYVELKVASNASAGQFPLTIQEVKMRTQSGNSITSCNYQGTLSLTDNHLGDVNHDRNITVSDAIGAMKLWLSTETNGLYKKQADMNLDGKINVSDVVRIVEKVINTEQ